MHHYDLCSEKKLAYSMLQLNQPALIPLWLIMSICLDFLSCLPLTFIRRTMVFVVICHLFKMGLFLHCTEIIYVLKNQKIAYKCLSIIWTSNALSPLILIFVSSANLRRLSSRNMSARFTNLLHFLPKEMTELRWRPKHWFSCFTQYTLKIDRVVRDITWCNIITIKDYSSHMSLSLLIILWPSTSNTLSIFGFTTTP